MPRLSLILALSLLPQVAFAHPGHLAEVAGHGHWLGAAALGAAIALGLWAGLKGKKATAESDASEAEEADTESEPQEA